VQWRSGELLADGLMRAAVVIQWDGLTEPHFEEADALAIGGVVFAIDATTMRIGA
jgi:hypothetical protein